MIVHEGPKNKGVGAEISARINEKGLDYLEAPVVRVAGYDIALPFFKRELEYIPDEIAAGPPPMIIMSYIFYNLLIINYSFLYAG